MRGVRLTILLCAVVSGMGSMWMMRSALESRAAATMAIPAQAPAAAAIQPTIEAPPTVDVLVAAQEVVVGQRLETADMRWQAWPADSASSYFFVRNNDPQAIETIEGSVARLPMVANEPLTHEKIVNLDSAGVLSSLLRNGMRAVSVPISDVTGAGGFILPGDFVDVLLTRQISIEEIDPKTGEVKRVTSHHQTDTVMETVRVLAIDQKLNGGEQGASAVGNTATLELMPEQAELMTLTRQMAQQDRGFITLSLRSFSEMVEEYGEDVGKVMPRTMLDLRAITAAKIAAAETARSDYKVYLAEQKAQAEADAERLRAEGAVVADQPEEVAVVPEESKEPPRVVLVRNGVPISVQTHRYEEPSQGTQ